MKIHHRFISVSAKLVVFLLVFLSCGDGKKSAGEKKGELEMEGAVASTYTCPMHPQIVQTNEGTCPICAMDLVLFDKNNRDEFLTLGAPQQQLANISVLEVGLGKMASSWRLNARIRTNPERTQQLSARVGGRLEFLGIRETGVPVKAGQLLYTIYSEELLSLQEEFILAEQQRRAFPEEKKFQELAQAAQQKLRLLGQSSAQMADLLKAGKAAPRISYYAPTSGIVAGLGVIEGQYVNEGSLILQIEQYDELWVEADVYPGEERFVEIGQRVLVECPGIGIDPVQMKIEFIEPTLSSGTQLLVIRGRISNSNGRLLPGMPAQVVLSRTSSEKITVPLSAVIRNGNRAHVWVKEGPEKFVPVAVKVGLEDQDSIEILEGISEGDEVVVTGAYLLYSEYTLKKGIQL